MTDKYCSSSFTIMRNLYPDEMRQKMIHYCTSTTCDKHKDVPMKDDKRIMAYGWPPKFPDEKLNTRF